MTSHVSSFTHAQQKLYSTGKSSLKASDDLAILTSISESGGPAREEINQEDDICLFSLSKSLNVKNKVETLGKEIEDRKKLISLFK